MSSRDRSRRARAVRHERWRMAGPVAAGLALAVSGVWVAVGSGAGAAPGQRADLRLDLPASTTTTTGVPVGRISSGIDVAPIGTTDARLTAVPQVAANPPVSISVESVGMTAPVDAIGVDGLGAVAVPPDVSRAGWYRFGSEPGSDGSAVIVAHVDYGGREGPFFRLDEVQPGDAIVVGRADGTSLRFVVSQRGQYRKDQLPTEALFRTDGAPQLVLITCGGEFVTSRRSYADNVVVIATPVP